MSENTANCDKRRSFVSGFDGSAGTAVITRNEALLWTDSRYFLEAQNCLDENWSLMKDGLPDTPTVLDWLKTLPIGSTIGIDPQVVAYSEWKRFSKGLKDARYQLVPILDNPVDAVWCEQGKPPDVRSKPYVYALEFAGLSWQRKLHIVRESMSQKKADLLVVSALDEVAWLFNLRGSDIAYTPVFKAYALITPLEAHLFLDNDLITPSVTEHLGINNNTDGEKMHIHPYMEVERKLKCMTDCATRVWINDNTPAFLGLAVPKSKLLVQINPVCICKAIKNHVELDNLKRACNRDAACLCQFFGFLEKNVTSTKIDEVSAAAHLLSLRSGMKNFVMPSFETISSVGPNGAIIHYRPEPSTAKTIDTTQLYLCDSGGNYLDGTTDITRTLHFGSPSAYEKEFYTLVLKGHIALASAVFPINSPGARIDALAHQFLWRYGRDYLHGTGHGIGMFLAVHEGPQRIGFSVGGYKLEVGNVLSNEPGFYEDGKFGIRIESMMTVVPVSTKYVPNNTTFLGFEMLSFIPMHMDLVNLDMLTHQEIVWLNDYHHQCIERVVPELEALGFKGGIDYLLKNTRPISTQKLL